MGLSLAMDLSLRTVLGGAGMVNAFSPTKLALNLATSDITWFMDGDSLWNATYEHMYLFLEALAPYYPAWTFQVAYYNSTNDSYDAATVIQTGSGPRTLTLWAGVVPGSDTRYLLGSRYTNAIANAPTPSLVIWGHAKNVDGSPYTYGEYYMGVETLKQQWPNAIVLHLLEPPNRDDTTVDPKVAAIRDIAQTYGDSLIDYWTLFQNAGKPADWYADNLHPSILGQQMMLPVTWALWNSARAATWIAHPAWLNTLTTNLLDLDNAGVDQGYGYFKNYVSGTPAGWSLAGTPTITKETTIVDTAMGDTFSVKIASSVGLEGIVRNVGTVALAAAKAAGVVTLAVRKYVDAAQVDTVGRIALAQSGTGAITWTSQPNPYMKGRWVWEILSGQSVASGITFLTPKLYCNSAAGASVDYYGRAILVTGAKPFGDQSAPHP